MARYPSGSYGRRRRRSFKWVYIIVLILLIAGSIIAVMGGYSPFSDKKEDFADKQKIEKSSDDKAKPIRRAHVKPVPVITPKPTPKPVVAPKPKPVVVPKPQPKPDVAEVVKKPVAEPGSEVGKLIDEAIACVNASPARIIEARDRFNELLSKPLSGRQRAFVKAQLSKLADEWLFSRKLFPRDNLCSSYKVKPGDQLRSISNQFKVPYEIFMEVNKISRPELLRAGEQIKVFKGPFNAVVYRSTFTMDLYLQDTFVRTFKIGIGKPGMQTPTGLWRVKVGGKMIEPPWPDPETGRVLHAQDPGYALGSRWIGIEGLEGEAVGRSGFGIHGTKDPQTIGTASSRGCIRLHNGDVIEVYNLLIPKYSQIKVVE